MRERTPILPHILGHTNAIPVGSDETSFTWVVRTVQCQPFTL